LVAISGPVQEKIKKKTVGKITGGDRGGREKRVEV
jgi:hypothetical protein